MRRRDVWLLAALVLFALAGWLMTRGERSASSGRKRPKEEDFPRQFRAEDFDRQQKHQVLPPPPEAFEAGAPMPNRDPLVVAMDANAKSNLVFEASAILTSPFGKLIIECFLEQDGDGLKELKDKHGLDLTRSIDRVAFSDRTIVLSGRFGDVKWATLTQADGGAGRAYGKGVVYASSEADAHHAVGVWGSELVVIGESTKLVEAAIDRLEGRSAPTQDAIPPAEAYGEVYGFIRGDDLGKLLPSDIAPRLRDAAKTVELHIDARDDVLIVADVTGTDPQAMKDLGKTLGGALSLARISARKDGNEALVELLDMARVMPQEQQFRVEAAFPIDYLRKHLCSHRQDGGTR